LSPLALPPSIPPSVLLYGGKVIGPEALPTVRAIDCDARAVPGGEMQLIPSGD